MSSLPVVAIIKAKPGQEMALEAMLRGLLKPTHQEAGCIIYALNRSFENPRVFVFIEQWISKEALGLHLKTPHIQSLISRKNELIEEMQVYALSTIPGGDPDKGNF